MINSTRLTLQQTTEIPSFVFQSEAYIKRHRNWIFESPDPKRIVCARAKPAARVHESCSSFVSSMDTSSSSTASVARDPHTGPPPAPQQPFAGPSYPRLALGEGAAPEERAECAMEYMKKLAGTLRGGGGGGKPRAFEMHLSLIHI